MNTKRILTTGLTSAVLICACVKQPHDIARGNPYDPGGLYWHGPVVTTMNDTTAGINDTITVTATGTDDGTVVKYIWARDGATYSDTTDSGSLKVAWPDNGRKVVRVKAIDDDGLVSAPDSCVVTILLDIISYDFSNGKGGWNSNNPSMNRRWVMGVIVI